MARFGCRLLCCSYHIAYCPPVWAVLCVFFLLCPFCPDCPSERYHLCPFFCLSCFSTHIWVLTVLLSRLSFLKAVLCVRFLRSCFAVHVPEVTVFLLQLSWLFRSCPSTDTVACPDRFSNLCYILPIAVTSLSAKEISNVSVPDFANLFSIIIKKHLEPLSWSLYESFKLFIIRRSQYLHNNIMYILINNNEHI
jgi:hypothetical protein